jgi:hypothetical protein
MTIILPKKKAVKCTFRNNWQTRINDQFAYSGAIHFVSYGETNTNGKVTQKLLSTVSGYMMFWHAAKFSPFKVQKISLIIEKRTFMLLMPFKAKLLSYIQTGYWLNNLISLNGTTSRLNSSTNEPIIHFLIGFTLLTQDKLVV